MENVKKILLEKYNLNAYCSESGDIYAGNKFINCGITSPCQGTNYKYFIRFSTVSAFDRWVNSTAVEEFFSTKEELVEFLTKNELDIYKQLLEYLSEEYNNLKEVQEKVNDGCG